MVLPSDKVILLGREGTMMSRISHSLSRSKTLCRLVLGVALALLIPGDYGKADHVTQELDKLIGHVDQEIASIFDSSNGCVALAPNERPTGFGGNSYSLPTQTFDRTLIVTSSEDTGSATTAVVGTMRWAVEEARKQNGGRILFDRQAMRSSRIALRATLTLPSNTIIDGQCSGISIGGSAATLLFAIHDVRNVVVRGLSFEKYDYRPDSRAGRDAITVYGSFEGVWIDRNNFQHCGDGCIDIVRYRNGDITISRNIFRDHNKVALFFNAPCKAGDAEKNVPCSMASGLGHPGGPRVHVTLFNNVFWRTGQRHPKVGAEAYVHAANNLVGYASSLYEGEKHGSAYGMLATDGGQLFAEGNVFIDLNRRRNSTAIGPQIQNGKREPDIKLGTVSQKGNVSLNGGTFAERSPGLVSPPAYNSRPDLELISAEAVDNGIHCIIARLRRASCQR